MNAHKLYFRSITRRWKNIIRLAESRVIVLRLYITSSTAETVLSSVKPSICEIYTVFSLENFANRSSSLRTIAKLHSSRFRLFHLPQLHAKVVIVSGAFASVGSQNLTAQGTRNREATVTLIDKRSVEKAEEMVSRWLDNRIPISAEMIEEMKKALPPFFRRFKALQVEMSEVDHDIADRERTRIEDIRREQLLKEEEERKRLLIERTKLAQRPARLKSIRIGIAHSPVASETIYGHVVGSIFVPERQAHFTEWIIGSHQTELTRLYRYLCILPKSGKIGWVKLLKTRLSKVSSSVKRTGTSDKIECGPFHFTAYFKADWSESPEKSNLEIQLERSGSAGTLKTWFSVDALEIVEWDFSGMNVVHRRFLEKWFPDNKQILERRLLRLALDPFRYDKNLHGVDADRFFEMGRYKITLHNSSSNQLFLVAE